MHFVKILLLLIAVICTNNIQGKTVRDTIFTTDGDRIIIAYELAYSSNQTTIKFVDQQKKLSRINAEKYKDLSKVAVMFFDRTGNYNQEVSITNMTPEAFMIPAGVAYDSSSEGFFMVQSEPRLYFSVKSDVSITIPIYLAYKPKKGKYILFSKSKELKIPLSPKNVATYRKTASQTIQQTVTSTSEIEADNTVIIKVMESVNMAKCLISEAEKLPFTDKLMDEISYLREKRREITDTQALAEIADVMDRYEAKKQMLEDKELAEQEAIQREEEMRSQKEAAAIKATNDSIAAAQKMEAEKAQKRSIWMIVGGVLLAILAFVANQILQHFRNVRNQKNMMELQQSVANRAEAEAKRRARNAIRTKQNEVANNVRMKVKDSMKKTNRIKINGKIKETSI